MMLSAEQLHGLIASIRDRQIAIVEAIGARGVSLNLTPGEQVLAEVIARLPTGQSLANIAGKTVSLPLPPEIKPGETIRLTFLAGEPRLTFALSQSERQGTTTTVSDTARWLGQITREPPQPTAPLTRPEPILSRPPTDPQLLAARLQQTLTSSGMFYESHLADWAVGERPLAAILQEPQGSLSQPSAFQKAATTKVLPTPALVAPALVSPALVSPALVSPALVAPALVAQTPVALPPSSQPDPAAADAALPAPPAPVKAPAVLSTSATVAVNTAPSAAPTGAGQTTPLPPIVTPAGPAPTTVSPGQSPIATPTGSTPVAATPPGATAQPTIATGEPALTASPSQTLPAAPAPPTTSSTGTPTMTSSQPAFAPMAAPSSNVLPDKPTKQTQPTDVTLANQRTGTTHEGPLSPEPLAASPAPLSPTGRPITAQPAPSLALNSEETTASSTVTASPRHSAEQTSGGSSLSAKEPADPRTIPLIREQLELLQNRTVTWQGEGWPGQPLQWSVTEREADPGEPQQRAWHSSLDLQLPRLGDVRARLQLVGKTVQIIISGGSSTTVQDLKSSSSILRDKLEAQGLVLSALEISHE